MIEDDLRNTRIAPDELQRRAPHTIAAGEQLVRSDGAVVRLLGEVSAVVVSPGRGSLRPRAQSQKKESRS